MGWEIRLHCPCLVQSLAGTDLVHRLQSGSGDPQDHLDDAIESLNRVIRKTIKTRDSFTTDEAATKLIYMACVFQPMVGRNSTG